MCDLTKDLSERKAIHGNVRNRIFSPSLLLGISFSYFSAMLPSIEKRFGFSSQSIGTVKAMSDVR